MRSVQDVTKLEPAKLTPLTPEVISRQATINIGARAAWWTRQAQAGRLLTSTHIAGTIGHVAHGKSTVVKAISGVQTVRFKNELERNITIKLGYANAKIYRCANPRCPRCVWQLRWSCACDLQSVTQSCCRPRSYKAYGSSKEDEPACDVPGFESDRMELLRHVSFVDCPGTRASSSTTGCLLATADRDCGAC